MFRSKKMILPLAIAALSTPALGESLQLEEVIVTATKRATSMQDVPIAITALGTEALEKHSVSDFESYARLLPGLSYIDAGSSKKKLTVRGLADGSDFDATLQATVSVYFNEIPLTSGVTVPDFHMFDVAQVELLRGPQGTLYGAGSLGGTLRIITNKPVLGEFEGKLDTTYSVTSGGDDSAAGNLMVNLPLGESAAVRAVIYNKHDGGFVDYINPRVDEENANDTDVTGGRVDFRWEPSDALSLNFQYMYQETMADAKPWFSRELGNLEMDATVKDQQDDETHVYNLTLEYDLESVNIFSSTTVFDGTNDWFFEYSENAARALPLFGPAGIEPVSPHHFNETFDIFAQEVRFKSTGDGPIQWIGGLFYMSEEVDHEQIVVVDRLDDLLDFAGAIGLPVNGDLVRPGGLYDVGEMVVYRNQSVGERKQKAIFGEISYEFNEYWSATIGGRYFETENGGSGSSRGVQNALISGAAPPGTLISPPSSSSDEDFIMKAELSYRPNEDQMYYLLASQGYRQGGSNGDSAVQSGAPRFYGSDTLWNYELGFKTQWMDSRLRLNGALYYLDWTNILSKNLLDNGFGYVDNAGEAEVLGFEVEGAFQISEYLSLDVGMDFKEAELQSPYYSAGSLKAASGDRLQTVPRLTYSASIHLDTPLTDAVDLLGLLSYQYVGDSLMRYEATATADDEVGDYGVLNARVAARINDDIELGIFANNIADEHAITTANNLSTSRVFTIRPRTIGVNLRYNF